MDHLQIARELLEAAEEQQPANLVRTWALTAVGHALVALVEELQGSPTVIGETTMHVLSDEACAAIEAAVAQACKRDMR